jgi:protein-disulfide isomerase
MERKSTARHAAGNPDGDVSVVAFFDYNCPYCREGEPALAKLIASDGKVRLVLKEYPILGRDSEAVARIAQAAISQGKYFELYQPSLAAPPRRRRFASPLSLASTRRDSSRT